MAVLGAPPLFKAIYGKPKLDISYDSSKGYKLWCRIRDVPVNNWVLRQMNVKRESLNIRSAITIKDSTGTIVSFLPYVATPSKDIRRSIVEVQNQKHGLVFVKDQDDKYGNILKPGLYTLELELWDDRDSREIGEYTKQFRANQAYPFVEWIP